MEGKIFPEKHTIFVASADSEIEQISGLPRDFQFRHNQKTGANFLHHKKCGDTMFVNSSDPATLIQMAKDHYCDVKTNILVPTPQTHLPIR